MSLEFCLLFRRSKIPTEVSLTGPLAAVSDYILDNSQAPILLGAVTSAALLGYHISARLESLKDLTESPLLTFRTAYTARAIYDLFEELGPEGRALIPSSTGKPNLICRPHL